MKFFPQGITVGDAESMVEKEFRINRNTQTVKQNLQNRRHILYI